MTDTDRPSGADGQVGTLEAWPDEPYWIEKVEPFRQGAPMLPAGAVTADDGRGEADADWPAVATLPAGQAPSIDALGVGALALVVGRYNGGEPMLVASPAIDEPSAVRFLECACDEQQGARTWLDHVSDEINASRRYGPCDPGRVAAALGLDAPLSRTLLQFVFTTADGVHVPDDAAVWLWLERESPVQLRVHVRVGGADRPSVQVGHLASQVARAIEWLAVAGDAPLSAFELLSSAERQRVAVEFNDTRAPVADGLTLHGLVAAQAVRTPDAIAVVHGTVEHTYRELEAQANHLATVLRRDYGVVSGGIVGVMMERSEKTVTALYGVMKAGAAYVPINPRHPWDTIRFMIENAGVSVLIVDSESIAAAASYSGELLVADIELPGAPDASAPDVTVAGSNLAYVIYTSGSTGRPKGVAVEHRAIVNTVLWRNTFYGIGPADVNLQLPSFAFDSSVVDIFCVLTAGGTLVIPDGALRLDARGLIALIVERGVTSCIATPSYYARLITELGGAVPSLRWVTLAGESATPQLVATHLEQLPGVALYNEYGPTENAVCSTACRLDRVEPTVSIGRPITNVSVLVLDASGRLCPIGVPGEIYLGGAGLARGYLGPEQLTTERFVPSPVPDVHQGRLYRTGDRGSWRADGALEFLGRLDGQVKVRGFRIELDEVELALMRAPGVGNAAVVCKEDADGARYLAAYAEGQADVAPGDLREHMRREVPEYMVPDVLALLPRLPLNLNGKIDRGALLAISDVTGGGEGSSRPDVLSPDQQALMAMWTAVLQRSDVTLDDNFFEIGGNSLRVMHLTSRIRAELSIDVDLIDIYTYPTLREQAERLFAAREA